MPSNMIAELSPVSVLVKQLFPSSIFLCFPFCLLNDFMDTVSLLLNTNALGFDTFYSGCGLIYFVRVAQVFDAITQSHIEKRKQNCKFITSSYQPS